MLNRLLPAALALVALSGCYPGEVTTPDGSFKLRTALHLVQPTETPRSVILLSDSQFDCGSSSDVPGEVSADLLISLGAMLREGSQNMLIRASRLDGGDWKGEYPVQPYDSVQWSGRWSEAFYMRVEESAVSSNNYTPYYYTASEFTQLIADADGELVLGPEDDEGLFEASFNFRDIGVSGQFTSTPCELEDGLMQQTINIIEDYLQDSNIDAEPVF